MKRIFTLAFAYVIFCGNLNNTMAFAQALPQHFIASADTIPEIYYYVQQQAVFPGNMSEYLADNMRYAAAAREAGIEGRVVAYYRVNTKGVTDSVSILKSVHALLDSEVVRLILAMPQWKPAVWEGEPTAEYYTLPINFQLEKKQQDSNTDSNNPIALVVTPKTTGPEIINPVKYLKRLKYPREAKQNNIKGKVIVQFLIAENGQVMETNIKESIHPLLDEEALRIAKKMRNWTGGVVKGTPSKYYVNFFFTFPPVY